MNEDLLTIKQVSQMLGLNKNTISRWLKEGKFPNAFQVERTIRIPRADVEALKQNGKAAS